MSVVRCAEDWKGRNGTFENVTNNRVVRKFFVRTDDKYDNQFTITSYFATDMGITFLSPHPDANIYTCRSLDADQRDDSPFAWDVTCTYSTEPLNEDEEDKPENPLDRPARITWDSEVFQKFTNRDKDGNVMVNSAGDPIEAIEVDDIRWVISITKNFASLPAWVLTVPNSVNSSAVNISGVSLPARTVKVGHLHIGELQVENDIPFYEVTVELSYKPGTWDEEVPDEGFNVSDGSGNVSNTDRTRIMVEDDNGDLSPPTEAVLLNGSGGVLANPTSASAVMLNKRVYQELDFSGLPLG